MKKIIFLLMTAVVLQGCATGRDLSSSNYLPEWENRLVHLPSPEKPGLGKAVVLPLAVAGNVAMNAYYVPTWALRRPLRGDNRLIVWHPLFGVGETAGSEYFSHAWNRDIV